MDPDPPATRPPEPVDPGPAVPGPEVPDPDLPGPVEPKGAEHPDPGLEDQGAPAVAVPVPRWGLGDVIMGLVFGLVLSSILAGIWLGVTGDDEISLGGQAFSQMGLWIGLAGGPILASRRKGSGSLATDFGWRFRWVDVALGAAAAVFAIVVVVPVVGLLLRPLLGTPDVSQPVKDLVDKADGPAIVGLFLVAAVGAPLVEELFFRGLLLRSIEKSLGTGWAIAGSSVFFGLAHPNDLPAEAQVVVMAALAALAVVLATLAVRTRRLGPSILAHAVFNAINLVVVLAGR